MDTFCLVEKVLGFHHATTSAPMVLGDLAKKANTTPAQVLALVRAWPAGYALERVKTQQYVAASERPMDLAARRARFEAEHAPEAAQGAAAPAPLRAAPSKILKRSHAPKQRMSMEDILERVRRKQAESADAAAKSQRVRHEFLGAQVPLVERVLRSLGKQRSFSMSEVVRKVQASAKSPLGPEEVREILARIQFVRVVDAGGVQCVELLAEPRPVASAAAAIKV